MSTPTRTPGQLKVSELKEELKKRGITPKGLKKDLVEKLEEVIQKEAEKESGNTSTYKLSQQVPASSNSPVRGGSSDSTSSVLVSNGVDSPLPLAESTQDSSLLPSSTDIRNEDYNSLPQVADTKSSHYVSHQQVADRTNQGIFGRENAEVKGHESDCILQAGHESALEPERMEHDSQNEEHMEHFDSAKKSPLGVVHGSEALCHDGMEGTADDSETTHTVHGLNESGVNISGPKALGSSACFQKPGLGDEAEEKPENSFDKDEMLISSHSDPSMVEKHSNILSSVRKEPMESGDAHIQCQGLDPPVHRLGAEAKINSDKEIFHISDKIADQIHSKTSEYQLEKQEEKGNSLTSYRDENLKILETGLNSVDMTKSNVVAIGQEATRVEDKYQSVSTDTISYDFKSEPRHSYQESDASVVKQEFECEPHRETDKCETKEQGNNSGNEPLLSGTDLNLEDMQRSVSNPVGPENMEPGYAQNQFISTNSSTDGLEFKPEIDHDGVEIDHLKQNKEEYYHSMGESTFESEKSEEKGDCRSFEKGFKSNETDVNLDEKQSSSEDILEPITVKIQQFSSQSAPEVLKSEHACNIEILEAAHHKQNQAEYNYHAVMNELKPEDQEVKVIDSTFQGDGVSILSTSNIILEELQQCKVVPYDEGLAKYQVGQIHQNSHHESEYESVSSFKEEVKELDQVMEDHHQCRKTGVHESEQENKVSLAGLENDKLLQSCAPDSSMVADGKQEIISALEDSMEREYYQSESIIQSDLVHESELKPGANAELLEGNDQHTLKMRKEEHVEQQDKTNELIVEDGKTLSPNEWNRKSEFSDHQPHVNSDSPREMLRDSKALKLGHTKTAEVVPMDVDFDEQIRKKRKDECSNEDNEPRQEPAKRQRRWNSGKNLLEAGNTKPLTTDTLKDMIPPEGAEISVDSSLLHPAVSHPATPTSQSLLKAEKTSFSRPAPPPLKSDSPSNGEIQRPRIVPPPLRSPTSSLKVERFLRPFTVKALKELLSETGRVKYFWIDQIKTHCYVTYSSVKEAVVTRNALYNLKWPINGGRSLIAEFVDHEEVKSHGEGQSASLTNTPNPLPHKNITQGLSPLAPQGSSAQALHSSPPPDLKAKETMTSKKDPEPEPAVYTLDDLFKKTRAKPHIYYLPLNEEQVAAKSAVRSQDQQNRLGLSHM